MWKTSDDFNVKSEENTLPPPPPPSPVFSHPSHTQCLLYACSSGPTPTACLCWRWRTWWSWVINLTPSVSSPTYSLWSTTCADTRCPWVGPVTSDLCSMKRSVSMWHPPHHPFHQPWLLQFSSIFTWWPHPHWQAWSQSCTSLMEKLGIVCVRVCVRVCVSVCLLSLLAGVMCINYCISVLF